MTMRKNVASQKVGFVMVDKTDFATPETGISPSGVIRKDGGASAALTNTVSELTNGYYVVTLTNSETNADLIQLRFHDSAASCATQFVVLYPDQAMTYASDVLSTLDDVVGSQIASILIDTASILADTITLSNATYGLNALETLCSDIKDETASILADTKEINSQCDSILADTITLSNATYGLDALESLCSQILTDTGTTIPGTISDVKSAVDDIESNVSNVISTLDDVVGSQIASILVDTQAISNISGDSAAISAVKDVVDSVLADTKTLSNATYGLDALETLCSDIKDQATSIVNQTSDIISNLSNAISTLDGPIHSTLDAMHSTIDGPVDSAVTQNTGLISDVLSTIDGPVISDLSNIESTVANLGGDTNNITSILADTKEINSQCDSILADTKTLSNATYGLDALESLCSNILVDTAEISNISGDSAAISNVYSAVTSILEDTKTTIPGTISDIKSAVDDIESNVSNVKSVVDDVESNVSNIHSTIDDFVGSQLASVLADTGAISNVPTTDLSGTVASILTDTKTTLDDKIDSILVDTKEITSQTDSILADTQTLSNATYGLDALETLCSDIKDQATSIIGYTDGIETILTGASFRKNVALTNFAFMMQDTNGDYVTSLSPTGTISKDGGAFASLTNSPSEIANGCYKVDLEQAEMNASVIILRFASASARDTLCFIHTID